MYCHAYCINETSRLTLSTLKQSALYEEEGRTNSLLSAGAATVNM